MFNRYFKLISIFIIFILLTSCAGYQEFPVSERVPSAEIEVVVNQDKYENNIIKIRTKYLVAPERLNPAKGYYVVWVNTQLNGIFNVGRLNSQTSKKSSLHTLTPYHPVSIFITAEDEPLLTTPKGIEICRIELDAVNDKEVSEE